MLTRSKSGAADTDARIVKAARTLIARGGAEACSMRAVAKASGVTAAAIYRHYPDKQTLVDHVVGLAFEAYTRSLHESIAQLPVGSWQRIASLGNAYLAFATEYQEEFRVLFMPLRGVRRNMADVPGQGGYRILRQCVADAIEAGAIREDDPDLISFFLWSRVHGIVTLLMACDLGKVIQVEGAVEPLNLFRKTRPFVLDGLMP